MYSLPPGSVGIGTSAPAGKFHVYTEGNYGTSVFVEDGGSGGFGLSTLSLKTDQIEGRLQAFSNGSTTKRLTLATLTDGTKLQLTSHEDVELRSNYDLHARLDVDGAWRMYDDSGVENATLDPVGANGAGQLSLTGSTGASAFLFGDNLNDGGALILTHSGGGRSAYLFNSAYDSGVMSLYHGSQSTLTLAGSEGAGGAYATFRRPDGGDGVKIESQENGDTSQGGRSRSTTWPAP